MSVNLEAAAAFEEQLDPLARTRVNRAADAIVAAKERGGKVAVATGSGPSLHEGVTTLIAELMRVGVIDAVTTSAAVVAHEMGGTLDKVKRCRGNPLGLDSSLLPRGGEFELSLLDDDTLRRIRRAMPIDDRLLNQLRQAEGKTIIKAAGNLGYPLGLWIERLSLEIRDLARARGWPFEAVAGLGADPRTMIGMGTRKQRPVLVSIPQLVGGGATGLCIADSIPVWERAERIARLLGEADVIVESSVALTQEIHDGPFERYTGHGLWSAWQGQFTYSLEGKTLVRIDLDPALELAYQAEQRAHAVQHAIEEGLPKTKVLNIPFRMEMSGFARHENSLPIQADVGVVWPVLASRIAHRLHLDLEFISYPQQSEPGQAMREAIVRDIKPICRESMLQALAGFAVESTA